MLEHGPSTGGQWGGQVSLSANADRVPAMASSDRRRERSWLLPARNPEPSYCTSRSSPGILGIYFLGALNQSFLSRQGGDC